MLILGAGYHKPHLGGWLPCKLILGAGYGSLDYGGRGLATGDGKFECTVIWIVEAGTGNAHFGDWLP